MPLTSSYAQLRADQPARTTMLGTSDRQFLLAKITVSDLPRSYAFYTEVLGLQWAHAPGAPEAQRPALDDASRPFVEIPLNASGSLADPFFVLVRRQGVVPKRAEAELTVVGVKVPNIDAAIARATRAGIAPARPVSRVGPMAFAMLRDPDGYTVELVEAPSYGPERGLRGQ